jgi:hypothetical protein
MAVYLQNQQAIAKLTKADTVKTESQLSTTESLTPLTQIDIKPLVETGGVPVAIILSVAVAIAIALPSITEFAKIFIPVILRKIQQKSK